MTCKPFPKDLELNKELDIPSSYPQNGLTPDKGNGTEISHRSAVPGQPLHCLDLSDVSHYLPDEILTPDLNRLAPSLWLVGIQQSSHISPLNRQIIKGREIHIAENRATLHLDLRSSVLQTNSTASPFLGILATFPRVGVVQST